MASELKSVDSSTKKKTYRTWEKRVKSGNVTKSIEVKEAENGFVITINEYGEKSRGGWYDESKCYISKTNPLAEMEEMDGLQKSIKEMDDSFAEGSDLFK